MKLSILFFGLALGACGSDPDTGDNPVCTVESCEEGFKCCRGVACIPVDSICSVDSDATTSQDTESPSDTEQRDTVTDTSVAPDSTVTDSTVTDSSGPVDTSDTSTDTTSDTDTSPGGLVLVDPGIHTLGGAVSAGGILLLDARLDGRSRVCTGSLCVEGGISP